MLVHIPSFVGIWSNVTRAQPGLLADGEEALDHAASECVERLRYEKTNLRHDDELVPRKIELLDGFAEDDFRETVRVHLDGCSAMHKVSHSKAAYIGGIKGLDARVVAAA
jgi:hypothetical protein